MAKTALVPIADGIEELEAVTIIDVLRRANTDVTVASVNDLHITASRSVNIIADKLIADCADQTYDLIVLPGGMPGAENLRDSKPLTDILIRHAGDNRLYAAICASPAVVLQHHNLLKNKTATCYPSLAKNLTDPSKADQAVVIDSNCITSQGPGTAIQFALTLVAKLHNKQTAKKIAKEMITTNPKIP